MSDRSRKIDAKILHDVLEELRWDVRVNESSIHVGVETGVVTLSGSVDSWAARVAAQDAAYRVLGVFDVVNEVKVRLPDFSERNDNDIESAVRRALEWDMLVPHERICATVSKGVVTLTGNVDHWTHYDDAARCVRNMAGVREIQNRITVNPPQMEARAVRRAIERALERHAAHAVKYVSVAVSGDTAVLSGEVLSLAERNVIEGAARGTRGIRNVDSRLRVSARAERARPA